jgi:hypothetical protein
MLAVTDVVVTTADVLAPGPDGAWAQAMVSGWRNAVSKPAPRVSGSCNSGE